MIRKSVIGLLLIMPLVMISLNGCGKSGGRTVATVGNDKITADDLNDYFGRLRMTFPTAQDEYNKRREILDTMVVTKLLVQAAYEKGIDKLDELARIMIGNKDKFLLAALYQKHIAKNVEPTDAEVKDFYNHLQYKIRVSHILVKDKDTAQMIFDSLKHGGNFEQLAYQYSIDPDAKRNRGDLGLVGWGETVDAFQQAAFAMKPGEISPPVKSPFGYHIIKLVDKLPNQARGDFDSVKVQIKSQVRNRKSLKITEAYLDSIQQKYPVTVDTTTCNYLMHKRSQLYPPQLLATLPRNDFDMDQLDRNEKELVLATWNGGQMTVSQYLTQLKDVPANVRPDLDDADSLKTVVFQMKLQDILAQEAIREGLENDPDYLHKMKMFKELNMADIMKNDSIPVPPGPDEGTVRQYYDDHPDEFTTQAKVHAYEILMSDEHKAKQLRKSITSLKEFKDKALDLDERAGKRALAGDLGYFDRRLYPEIFDLAVKTPVGSIGGPVVTGTKYSIFYVVDKIQPELKDFLGVKRSIVEKLQKEQKDKAIQQWIDAKLKSTKVDVNDEAVWSTIDMSKYPKQADTTMANN
ncbi:MAG TPA: peptidylprolyl isomerase [candidate division Zixibacteria bacterium]|nr:peptidylprolyl isomerase [candidate division Zixibacteria bacterium]